MSSIFAASFAKRVVVATPTLAVRRFTSGARVAAPRSLAMPMASQLEPVASTSGTTNVPTKEQMVAHYAKFVDVYEDEPVVETKKAETKNDEADFALNKVYFVNGGEGRISLA